MIVSTVFVSYAEVFIVEVTAGKSYDYRSEIQLLLLTRIAFVPTVPNFLSFHIHAIWYHSLGEGAFIFFFEKN